MVDAAPPFVGGALEQRLDAVELDRGLRDGELHLRMMGVALAVQRRRRAGLGVFDREIEGASRSAVIDRGDRRYRGAENPVDERIGRGPGRQHADDMLRRGDDVFEQCVVAPRTASSRIHSAEWSPFLHKWAAAPTQ